MIDIRQFLKEDIEKVINIWNESLEKDLATFPWYIKESTITKEHLEKALKNPNLDPEDALVAHENKKTVGAMITVAYKSSPWKEKILPPHLEDSLKVTFLPLICVAPEYRNQRIGSRLFEEAIKFAKKRNKEGLWVSYFSPIKFITGVIGATPGFCFLVRKGFRAEWPQIRMRLDFSDFKLKNELIKKRLSLEKEGIIIKYFSIDDPIEKETFTKLMKKHFVGWWCATYKESLEKGKNLPFLIAFYKRAKKVVGFIGLVRVSENGGAGFAPGTDPDYRGKGIGKLLINLWAEEVKKLGARESIIMTGTENTARNIYFEMGYQELGIYWTLLKKKLVNIL